MNLRSGLPRPNSFRDWLVAFVAVVFPSFGLIQKYGGMYAVLAYFGIAILALGLAERYRGQLSRHLSRLSTRQRWAVAAAFFSILLLTFLILYPIANSGRFGGGSDSDEALNSAAQALMRGQYPYYQRTYANFGSLYLFWGLLGFAGQRLFPMQGSA